MNQDGSSTHRTRAEETPAEPSLQSPQETLGPTELNTEGVRRLPNSDTQPCDETGKNSPFESWLRPQTPSQHTMGACLQNGCWS